MGNQQRLLFVPRTPLNSANTSAFHQLSVSFSCYPCSLTRFGPTDLLTFISTPLFVSRRWSTSPQWFASSQFWLVQRRNESPSMLQAPLVVCFNAELQIRNSLQALLLLLSSTFQSNSPLVSKLSWLLYFNVELQICKSLQALS